jgi:hypothetical protein
MRFPVEEPSQLDAQVGHHPGHVGGADLGLGDLGDDGILQAHDEAQQQHRGRHEHADEEFEVNPEQSEDQQQSRPASTIRLKAYSPCNCRRRAQLMRTAVVAAPATKARSDDSPAMARATSPSTRSSAIAETMPVMCEV